MKTITIARWACGLFALAACHSAGVAVMPNLMAVPEDKRDAVIQSSLSRPTAEEQPASQEGRDHERFAATVAAYLGMMFSQNDNASFGATWNDVGPSKRPTTNFAPGRDTKHPHATHIDAVPNGGTLVPWVQLKPP
jgi:hypothetical protein